MEICASGHCTEGGGWRGHCRGEEEMGGGLKGSDHKEQEQSVFVAVCAASIRAITDTRELISNGKT